MKKPLNYRLQMYRALVEKMCTNCWFWCIFLRFYPFLCVHSGFLHYLCNSKLSKKGMSYNLLKGKRGNYFWCSE